MTRRPFYLDVAGGTYCVLHEADGSAVPVLFCPPFGWDEMCSYRARRDWASYLADAGHAALRVDLPGTGDSAGTPRDTNLLTAWTDAVHAAAGWLTDATGHDSVAVVGLGLGGLLSVLASAAGAPISSAVLWGVPARGRTLVRELRATATLERDGTAADDGLHAAPAGALEVGGYLLSRETLEALKTLEVTGSPVALRRVLLLERDGLAPDQRLAAALRDAGAGVEQAPGAGWGRMMVPPQEAQTPWEVIEHTGRWLASEPSASSPADARASGAPPGAAEALILWQEKKIHERPLRVRRPSGDLAGVVSSPTDGPAPALCAVFLNSGALRRTGPNRLWVEMARDHAARGGLAARIDVEGLGDADGDATEYFERAAYNVPELVAHVGAVLDHLVEEGVAERFALIGLCSGGHQAFQTTLSHPRASAAMTFNCGHLFWDAARPLAREARPISRVADPAVWLSLMRGQVRAARLRQLIAARAAGWRVRSDEEIPHAFDRLRQEGKRLLLCFSGHEPLFAELDQQGLTQEGERWPNVEFASLPGAVHTLRPLVAQRRAHELFDDFMRVERERPFSVAVAAPATAVPAA